MLGVIKLFNKQNCDGCVMADDGRVMFFHRAGVAAGYQPKVGDRVTFQRRVNPGSGGQEAYQIAAAVKTAAWMRAFGAPVNSRVPLIRAWP
jgi:cold shock CspA family protein